MAYRLEDFMQEINDERYDNLLKESYFCKQNSNLRPKYKFNLDHCGRYIFYESKKLDKCINCRYGDTYIKVKEV